MTSTQVRLSEIRHAIKSSSITVVTLMFVIVRLLALLLVLSHVALSNEQPTILWWTNNLYPHFGVDETYIACDQGSCRTSKRRERKDDRNPTVILFYGSDLREDDLPLPRHRNHYWALLHEESPLNNYIFSHRHGIALFNYTATFRRHSDYPLTTQFLRDLNYLTSRLPINLEEKNRLRQEEGLALAVYVQSHCSVPSDRDRYVAELAKYVSIDSYGSCLHNKDLPKELNGTENFDNEKFLNFLAKYKFHVAFENALCPDYMTEKLFRAWHVGSVPIYRGSRLVRDWQPADPSVIVADDFKSPQDLASFIKELDADDTMYKRYLQFKDHITNKFLLEHMKNRLWDAHDDFFRGFECFLCDKLLQRRSNPYPKWANASHMGCPEPHPSLGDERMLPPDDPWLQQVWSESYWYAYDLARALQVMISSGEVSSSAIHDYVMAMKFKS